LNGAAGGVLVTMTLKPGWAWSVAIVITAALIAGLGITASLRRGAPVVRARPTQLGT
jgi:hypothetical protein